jgi:F0F1-type ATP synthase gamma subunit
MKSAKNIDAEIEKQIKALKKKKIKPEILLLGQMTYYTLKVNNKELIEAVPNSSGVLRTYKELLVLQKPLHEHGGVFKAEHETVEVFGK